MGPFEEKVKKLCDDRELPGVILLARDNRGNFQYTWKFGLKTPTEPMDLDATFVLASCTKLPTTVAALQCVERGLIGLDDDVSPILTELKNIDILTGFQEEKDNPILKKAERKITLRHLLTHSSGFGYDINEKYKRWTASQGAHNEGQMSMLDKITVPLLFEPGTSWEYGYGVDWVGILVMRLSKMSLEDYMQKNLWDPLGIKNITFHQDKKRNVKKNLVKMSRRVGNPIFGLPIQNGEKVEWIDDFIFDPSTPDEYGGGGLTGSVDDFMKILQSIGGNDGKLLKSEMVDEMFTPQLTGGAEEQYQNDIALPWNQDVFASHKAGTKVNWGLGGMMVLEDEETGRKSGTLSWSGLPNLLWSIDREAGLNLFYASNIVPNGDHKSGEIQRLFEKEMYDRHAESAWFSREWRGPSLLD